MNKIPYPFGQETSLKVLETERKFADSINKRTEVLLPVKEAQIASLENLGLIFIKKEDAVLSRFKMPPNLSLIQDSRDPRQQIMVDSNILGPFENKSAYGISVMTNKKPVLKIFIKNSGYDYYGYTTSLIPSKPIVIPTESAPAVVDDASIQKPTIVNPCLVDDLQY